MALKPTTEQLKQEVGVICKVIAQIPCFFIYEEYIVKRFEPDKKENDLFLKAITHNAALDSALLNLRCFNEFFKQDGKQDDVRAYHYSGISMKPFLSLNEERDINKYLAHITLTRCDIVDKSFLVDDMTIRGLRHGIRFLSFINVQFPKNTDDAYEEVQGVLKAVNAIIQKIITRRGNQET